MERGDALISHSEFRNTEFEWWREAMINFGLLGTYSLERSDTKKVLPSEASVKIFMVKKFKVITLGCKVNQFESESLAKHLQDSNWVPAGADDSADICIINTCTVTQKASMQSRQSIRQAVRANPCAKIIVTGCYADSDPDAIAKIGGVTTIADQKEKFDLPQIILTGDLTQQPARQPRIRQRPFEQLPALGLGNRSRPFLKIQDGCDAFCTYCIVPHIRGENRSMPMNNVMDSLDEIHRSGYRETVLTGIHLGRWGFDLEPATDLVSLIREIRRRKSVERVRLSSIEPGEVTDELIRTVREAQTGPGRICPHFHIPLQSGDNEILERMHRPYDRSQFHNKIDKIHQSIPNAAIGTDVLIGFPGESERAFRNTCDLIAALPITYLHVFPFSPRRGTPAYHYPNPVPPHVIKERCKQLRDIGLQKKSVFYNKFNNKLLEVVIEGKPESKNVGKKGMSENYIPVVLSGPAQPPNQIKKVVVERVSEDLTVLGRPV